MTSAGARTTAHTRRPTTASARRAGPSPLLGCRAHARPDRPRPRYGHRPGRDLRRRPGRPPARRKRSPSRPAGSKASPRARARASASASWSTARGASPQSHLLTTAEADRVAAEAVRIARASATALRQPSRSTTARRRTAATRRRSRRTRSTVPLETQDRRPAGRRPGRDQGQGHRLHGVELRRPARVEDVRGHRRQPAPSRSSPTSGRRSRPTPSTATSTSAAATRTPAAAGRRRATSTSAGLDLGERAEPLAEEAVALLTAPQCPSGRFTIILDPSQLYLQVHECAATPPSSTASSAPRRRYAGTSFLTTDKLDEGFRYGSDLIDIVADATAPGGMGTFGWDDEGVAAQAVPLVKNGHLRRLPVQPRDGAADRAAERRRDAGRRLEPDPADPDDQHQPAAAARHEPRRDRRRHRRRAVPRVEPVAGRSTTAGSTSSSRPRSPTRSRAARRAGCSRTRPTPGSPTSSGARATRSATSGAT